MYIYICTVLYTYAQYMNYTVLMTYSTDGNLDHGIIVLGV